MSEQNDPFQAMCLRVVFCQTFYEYEIMKDSGSKQIGFTACHLGKL